MYTIMLKHYTSGIYTAFLSGSESIWLHCRRMIGCSWTACSLVNNFWKILGVESEAGANVNESPSLTSPSVMSVWGHHDSI